MPPFGDRGGRGGSRGGGRGGFARMNTTITETVHSQAY